MNDSGTRNVVSPEMNINILNSISDINKENIKEELFDNLYIAVIYEYENENDNLLNITDSYDHIKSCYAKSKLEAYQKFILSNSRLFSYFMEYFYDKKIEIKNLCDNIKTELSINSNKDFFDHILNFTDKNGYIEKMKNNIYLFNIDEFKNFHIYLHKNNLLFFNFTKNNNILIDSNNRVKYYSDICDCYVQYIES